MDVCHSECEYLITNYIVDAEAGKKNWLTDPDLLLESWEPVSHTVIGRKHSTSSHRLFQAFGWKWKQFHHNVPHQIVAKRLTRCMTNSCSGSGKNLQGIINVGLMSNLSWNHVTAVAVQLTGDPSSNQWWLISPSGTSLSRNNSCSVK